jgi:transposase InsO family protein
MWNTVISKEKTAFSLSLSFSMSLTAPWLSFHIGLTCTAIETVQALGRALEKRGKKLVIRTDNGPQFVSQIFGEACESWKLKHERIPVRTLNKNAHIEAFHRILEDECLSIQEYTSFGHAYDQVQTLRSRSFSQVKNFVQLASDLLSPTTPPH